MLLAAVTVAAAALLLVAGVAKLRTPGPAAAMITGALRVRRSRSARRLARAAGLVEAAVAVAALVVADRAAFALLAGCYLVLTALAVRLATAPRPTACGCFGAADGAVGPTHVLLDLACLAAAAASAVHPSGGAVALFGSGASTGTVLLAQAALLAALGYLSITALPALAAARRILEGDRR